MTNDPEYTLHRLHKRFREFQQCARFSRARSSDPRKELAGRAEHLVYGRLIQLGYQVARTGYNEHFDLWCEGAKVEVKGASWSGGRYQAAIRNHEADLLFFGCLSPRKNAPLHFFIIPAHAYTHTNNIAIWTQDPSAYQGQWYEFYAAWWWVDAIVSRLPAHRGWQPPLF